MLRPTVWCGHPHYSTRQLVVHPPSLPQRSLWFPNQCRLTFPSSKLPYCLAGGTLRIILGSHSSIHAKLPYITSSLRGLGVTMMTMCKSNRFNLIETFMIQSREESFRGFVG